MLPILDKSLQKEYSLLKRLDSEDRWWTSQELADVLDMSKRTIHKYLRLLTGHLTSFAPSVLSIEFCTTMGTHLRRAPGLNIHMVYMLFVCHSLVYGYFNAMFQQRIDTSTDFCLHHYVSPASLYRLLTPMKKALAFFSLELSVADLRLIGSEYQIRYFYNNFYLQIFRGYDWPFPDIKRQPIMDSIDEILAALGASATINARKHFSYWLAIILHRMDMQHYLTDLLPAELGLDNEAYGACRPAICHLFQKFHQPVLAPECQFVFFLLYAFPFGERAQQRLFAAARDACGFDCLPLTATDHFLAAFMRRFPDWPGVLTASFRQKLHRLHFHGAVLSGSSDLLERYPFLKTCTSSYPHFMQHMKELHETLLAHPCGQCFSDPCYLLPHYILLCSQNFDLTAGEEPIRLRLYTDYGPIYENKIEREIVSRYADGFHLQFVTSQQEAYDILITNIPAHMVIPGCVTLSIHVAFNAREWSLLYQLLVQTRTAKSHTA